MKYKLVAFWLIVFGALFAFLQMCFEYHFYYIEQSQLFLFSEAYIRNKLLLSVPMLGRWLLRSY